MLFFLEFRLEGRGREGLFIKTGRRCECGKCYFSWNSVWRGREEGEGCLQVGTGVRVQKFLEICGG